MSFRAPNRCHVASQARQASPAPAGSWAHSTTTFEVRRLNGPSIGQLTVLTIRELVRAGLLIGEDLVADPESGPTRLDVWPRIAEAFSAPPEPAPSPPPTLVEATYDPAEDPDILGEYSIDLDGPMLDGISVDLETLVHEAQARVQTPTRDAPPGTLGPLPSAEWMDFDALALEVLKQGAVPAPIAPPAPRPTRVDAPPERARERPAAPRIPRVRTRPRSQAPLRQTLGLLSAIIITAGLLLLLPRLHEHPSLQAGVPQLFWMELGIITALGTLLMVTAGGGLDARDRRQPPGWQSVAAIAVGLLLGTAMPSLGLADHGGAALLVRLGLALSLELVFRASLDAWLAAQWQGVLRPILVSGALFTLLYGGALAPWLGNSPQLWGACAVLGTCLAGVNALTESPRLAALTHIAAALAAAVIVA